MLEYEKKRLSGVTDAELASNDWLWPLDRKVDVPREFPNPNVALSMRLLAQESAQHTGEEMDIEDDEALADEDVDEDDEFDEDEEDELDATHEDRAEDEEHAQSELSEHKEEPAQLTNTKPAVPVACGLDVFDARLSAANASEFGALGLKPELVEELQRQFNITQPSDIQTVSVPVVLQGHDVIIAGQTGTGKTLAYLLPLMQRLRALQARADYKRRGQRTRVIIVVPNRELVSQIVV